MGGASMLLVISGFESAVWQTRNSGRPTDCVCFTTPQDQQCLGAEESLPQLHRSALPIHSPAARHAVTIQCRCVDARRGDTALGSLSWAAYSPSYSVPLPAAACTTVRSLALEDWDWISSVLHGKLGVSYRRRTWAAALGMANSDPNWPSRSPPASQVGESCPGDRGAADPGTWGPLEAPATPPPVWPHDGLIARPARRCGGTNIVQTPYTATRTGEGVASSSRLSTIDRKRAASRRRWRCAVITTNPEDPCHAEPRSRPGAFRLRPSFARQLPVAVGRAPKWSMAASCPRL
ncbi:hypothetical protein ACCO45_011908 [Purpureocillium lilacinum]|uniref:Uncharacterized protein n=1 Tax=Purpureocillium lilacinum TaxID=33203 RepID=A0ACC4DCR8_PURLI